MAPFPSLWTAIDVCCFLMCSNILVAIESDPSASGDKAAGARDESAWSQVVNSHSFARKRAIFISTSLPYFKSAGAVGVVRGRNG